tara:strand:+ start:171 stop:356 length:186 start_codon:yes stop_codon:yes gene_type:complete
MLSAAISPLTDMNYALIAQQTKANELKSTGKIVTPQFRCKVEIVDEMTPLQRLKAKRNCAN